MSQEKLYDSHATISARVPGHVRAMVETAAKRTGARSVTAYIAQRIWPIALRDMTEDIGERPKMVGSPPYMARPRPPW